MFLNHDSLDDAKKVKCAVSRVLELRSMTMNTGFRYFCFICASLLATQVFAQDMSGWSDKTVCRLVKSGAGQQHIEEAANRGIVCEQGTSPLVQSTNKAPLDNPLDKIKVSKNMVLVNNRAVFNQEREAIKIAFANKSGFYWKGASVENCFLNIMMNWEESMKVEVANSLGVGSFDAYHRPISICSAAMAEQLSRLGTTPDYLEDIMLKWSTDEVFELPAKSLSASEYQLRMYAMASDLGVHGGYYAIHYEDFNYTDQERQIVEDYFSKQLIRVDMSNSAPRGLKSCDFTSTSRLAKGLNNGKISVDTCGSPMLKATTGAVALGLRLGNQDLFNAGIKNLKLLLKVFDEEGIFVPYAASRGATALGYSSEIPLHLGAWTELLAIAGYDFLEHKAPNGMRIRDLVAAQIKVLNNPDMLLKYTASNGAYGGKGGPTVANFNTLSLVEKWKWSNTGIKQIVRQSARYVERFRPDLQEFRDQNYVEFDQHGNVIKSTDGHTGFDPYMLYEANTKDRLDAEMIKHSVSDNDDKRSQNDKVDSDLKKPLPVAQRWSSDYTFDDKDEVMSRDPTQCNFTILRHISDGQADKVIVTGRVVLRDGRLKFSDEGWSTGSASQQQKLLENKANLKMMKQTGITGIAPLYAMVILDHETPQPAVYVQFGGERNKPEVELEGAHFTFYAQRSIGFTLNVSGCEVI